MEAARSVRRAGISEHWEANPLLSSVFVLWRSLAAREHEGALGGGFDASGKSARLKKTGALRKAGR
ncbi:MAG: hypothetical protein HYV04_09425 [Deltaproteobacteria bacterium]|nr:hypothetical protein [Deltaproteobacteria bacterium]